MLKDWDVLKNVVIFETFSKCTVLTSVLIQETKSAFPSLFFSDLWEDPFLMVGVIKTPFGPREDSLLDGQCIRLFW